MIFNSHSDMSGQHAFLSPSKYHWLDYTDDKLDHSFSTHMAARRGDQEHAFAAEAIRLGHKLRGTSQTVARYVNDAIGFRMTPEQLLFYSPNCFGTADAIAFRSNKLRVHDLKTGVSRTSEKQLVVYAALFCLEYGIKPFEIDIELRIYQSDEARIYEGDRDYITHAMDKIKTFDRRITSLRMEALR